MKKITIALCLVIAFSVSAFGQNACSQTTKLSGGTNVDLSTSNQKTGNISGTDYHYEIWVNSRPASAKLTLYGANQGGGGAFKAEWNNNDDYLGRVGYMFGNSGKKWNQYDNICVDFNYTRSANGTGGNYSYIGIYGWTLNPVMEWYIIDDWFGSGQLGPATICGNNCSSLGTVTVDGGTYNIYTNTRPAGSGCVGCNGQAFPQIFSIRQGMANGTRKCGTYSVKKHFEAWSKISNISSKIGNNLYEAKFLAEAGGGTGWLDLSYLKLTQTKNECGSGSTTPSSNSGGGTTPSSSSTGTTTQATTCSNFIGNLPANPNPPANPYTACFKHTNNKCYVCKVSNEGNGNTCRSTWVWNGTQVASNLTSGYWYQEVSCPLSTGTPTQATTCPSSNLITYGTIPANPYAACFKHTNNKCYVCKVSDEGNGNTCASSWLWNNVANVNDNLAKGYWYREVSCPASGYSATVLSKPVEVDVSNDAPILGNHIPLTHFSARASSGGLLHIEANNPTVVEIFDLKGNKATSFDVSGSQTVKLQLPNGVYFTKVHGMRNIMFMLR